jgi:hypothetical protein
VLWLAKDVPLAGAVSDSEVHPALSTFLQVVVIIYTPWTRVERTPMYLSFCCGKALSICYIIGIPMLMDMGPTTINLSSGRICCHNYNMLQIPIILKEPIDTPLPLHMAVPESNEMIQAHTSVNVKGVHAIVSILSRSGTSNL